MLRGNILDFKIEDYVSLMASIPHEAVVPILEHAKKLRAPVDKSRVLMPGVTGQIPELLRIAVKLHRHHYC